MPAYSPDLLSAARKAQRLSRREVAQALGCSPYTLTSYEHGQRHPSVERLGALADLLGCDVGCFYA